MRRGLVPVVIAAWLWVPAAAVIPLHLHEYGDHDHADHHHGPAVHSHTLAVLEHDRHDDGRDQLEGCDPGAHAVSVDVAVAAAPARDSSLAMAAEPFVLTLPPCTWRSDAPRDDRVHGPPRLTDGAPRAPPQFVPA